MENLSTASVEPGSKVLIRGFGLTAIDAVLALTEGRGGTFESTHDFPRYLAAGEEPGRIDIVSRSGRPMLAKPEARIASLSSERWSVFRDRLQGLSPRHGDLHFRHDIWPVLCDAAAAAVQLHGQPHTSLDVETWWRSWSRYKMSRCDAGRAMLQSYAVATGKRPPDIAWALGEAWRQLFPQLVELISYGGLSEEDWPAFQLTAREMERVAFGPPAATVGKMLALIRCGIMNLVCSVDTSEREDWPAYNAVIDAVTAGPRELIPQGPLAILLESGQLQRDEVSGAIKVDPAGRPLGSTPGLAVFGRATEGWILGNDSLSRTLHPHIFSWAKSIQVLARKAHA